MSAAPPPERVAGYALWRDHLPGVEARFVGRGPTAEAGEVLAAVEGRPPSRLGWTRQIHSALVLEGREGLCGEGDALVTSRRELALAVVTADCVPVLLAAGDEVAAVHAGWRGIAGGVVGATLDRLSCPSREVVAWIGPSIGRCCYEVGGEVAAAVVSASHPRALAPGRADRPHLDLQAAVGYQLEARGVEVIRCLEICTFCQGEALWSYRREGRGAGRNLAVIWRA